MLTLMRKTQGITLLVILASLFAGNAMAKTVYIHDQLRIHLRSGPTNTHKIINYLRSGTTLQQLETSSDGKWAKVRFRSKDYWIETKYLSDTPVAADRLVKANSDLAAAQAEMKSLKEQLDATNQELNALKSVRSKLDSSNSTLQEELEAIQRTARNAINTERSYRKLQESTELLKVELENLKAENAILQEDNLKEGIKWGIIAVIIGAIMAVMIPKMSGKKRRSEW